jgi:hypothetical protein
MALSEYCGIGWVYCSTWSDQAVIAASQWLIVYKTAPPARGTGGAAKRTYAFTQYRTPPLQAYYQAM